MLPATFIQHTLDLYPPNNRLRNILIAIALLIFHNECLIYVALRLFTWQTLPCQQPDNNCTRLLLVADPQILGNTFDTNGYAPIARRDADRYLAVTYAHAIGHSQPDAVVFLGDLMDEGSVANDVQFEQYSRRFDGIYAASTPRHVRVLQISGDNDIGGETLDDIVTDAKVARFQQSFRGASSDYVDVVNRTRIVNVNLLTGRTPNVTAATTPAHMWRIVVTHMSLLAYPGFKSERVSSLLRIITDQPVDVVCLRTVFSFSYAADIQFHSTGCGLFGPLAHIT